MNHLQLLWPVPAALASAAGAFLLRALFRRPGEWRQPRAWVLAALLMVGVLLAWRFSLDASPIGRRALLERHTGLELPFWPKEGRYVDGGTGTIVGSMQLSPAELAQVPRGARVSPGDAASLLRDARSRAPELPRVTDDALLESTTRCRHGWYSVVLVDRRSGRLWITLFYPYLEGILPCIPE